MNIAFRAASNEDIDTLVNFMRQFYAIDNYPFDESIARNALRDMIGNPTLGRIWLIDYGNEAIGYIVITFGYSLEYHGRDAILDEFFIKDAYRHQGFGMRAMQFVVEECRANGIDALHLEVERTNLAGQALYRKFGFEDHDRYLMTRRIEESS